MKDKAISDRRIAKNTVLLYIRTFFIMVISLYTSRVILQTLGVEDFGIYNVVGGFVAMFALLSGSLSNSISRFVTFELGRGDKDCLKDTFSTSVIVQIILSLIIVFIAEIFGTWFLNEKFNISEGRMTAANWAFQCSLCTFVINLISIPYTACIIAHERMKAFAYISILDAVLKLVVVLILCAIDYDRLILYALLLVLEATFIRIIYGIYCRKNFEETHCRFVIKRRLIREMVTLAGWNMLGASGAILNTHGNNILMNLFFGVNVNAARGIANQVEAAVTSFVSSFTTAVNPRITKAYAQENFQSTFDLVLMSSKYSYFLMLILVVPIVAETPFVLKLWLIDFPEYSVLFIRLTLVSILIASLSTPLYTLSLATGDVKKYQITIGSLSLMGFFLTLLLFRLGFSVEWTYYAGIIINVCILFARVEIVFHQTKMSATTYYNDVVTRALLVTVPIVFTTYILLGLFPYANLLSALLVIIFSLMITCTCVAFIGMSRIEREYALDIVKSKLNSLIYQK